MVKSKQCSCEAELQQLPTVTSGVFLQHFLLFFAFLFSTKSDRKSKSAY